MFKLLVVESHVPRSALVRGALLGAVGFEVLKLGANLLLEQTQGNPAFQAFGVALILLVWINYFSRLVMYAAAWAYTAPAALAQRTDRGDAGPGSGTRARPATHLGPGHRPARPAAPPAGPGRWPSPRPGEHRGRGPDAGAARMRSDDDRTTPSTCPSPAVTCSGSAAGRPATPRRRWCSRPTASRPTTGAGRRSPPSTGAPSSPPTCAGRGRSGGLAGAAGHGPARRRPAGRARPPRPADRRWSSATRWAGSWRPRSCARHPRPGRRHRARRRRPAAAEPRREGTTAEQALHATIGPAAQRLTMTFGTPRTTWTSGGRTRLSPAPGPPRSRTTSPTTWTATGPASRSDAVRDDSADLLDADAAAVRVAALAGGHGVPAGAGRDAGGPGRAVPGRAVAAAPAQRCPGWSPATCPGPTTTRS